MANNVFGTAITNQTLKKVSDEYKAKAISRLDRAKVALQKMQEDSKGTGARTYGEKESRDAADDGLILLIYNATGDAVTLVDYHDWRGQVGISPLPQRLENGQWGAFFHRKNGGTTSKAAIIYDGKNNFDTPCQWIFGWGIEDGEDNKCIAQVHQNAYTGENWNQKSTDIDKATSVSRMQMSMVIAAAAVGQVDIPIFEGIMTLDGAW